MEDIAHLKKESQFATQERDSLLKANAKAKAALRQRCQEVAVLEQGNAAVDKEVNRMNEENATLLETHLNSKNIIKNFNQENEHDGELTKQLEDSNKLIKEQIMVEKLKITEARNLLKLLKQELIQESKERD